MRRTGLTWRHSVTNVAGPIVATWTFASGGWLALSVMVAACGGPTEQREATAACLTSDKAQASVASCRACCESEGSRAFLWTEQGCRCDVVARGPDKVDPPAPPALTVIDATAPPAPSESPNAAPPLNGESSVGKPSVPTIVPTLRPTPMRRGDPRGLTRRLKTVTAPAARPPRSVRRTRARPTTRDATPSSAKPTVAPLRPKQAPPMPIGH